MFRVKMYNPKSISKVQQLSLFDSSLTSRSSTSSIKNLLSTQAKQRDCVELNVDHLTSSYRKINKELDYLEFTAKTAIVCSQVSSLATIVVTHQSFTDSAVAMSLSAMAALFVVNRIKHTRQLHEYLKLSLMTHQSSQLTLTGPSTCVLDNQRISNILSGDKPEISINTSWLRISGPLNTGFDSPHLPPTLARIRQMDTITIPESTLNERTINMTIGLRKCWSQRLRVPFSSPSMLLQAYNDLKKSKYNLAEYLEHETLTKARESFSQHLNDCHEPNDILYRLIDESHLLGGGMHFLNHWVQGKSNIGVKVDFRGNVILQSKPDNTRLAPYPSTLFPIRKNTKSSQPVLSDSVSRNMNYRKL